MAVHGGQLRLSTSGNSDVIDITDGVAAVLRTSGVELGTVFAFVTGSTAALTTMEYEPGAIADLRALLDELVPIVRPEADRARVQLLVDCDGAPDVNGDPAMLRQAFLNLALNACQAMPDGGTLRIKCESVRGRRVAVVFRDTGVGIAPADLQRIFDLYFTTKEKGSGIGLSMVYRTVQMHDGEIEVQSTPGAGTTFRLLLPRA